MHGGLDDKVYHDKKMANYTCSIIKYVGIMRQNYV